MSFNHYYQSELTALRQLGKRFAERNPALASFLGQGGCNPSVERLLEGFPFLAGRLRKKLNDEAHSPMYLLLPNCMRSLPSFSVLICLSILSGCTAQPKNVFIANLENICSYPVSVIAHEYSNAKDPFVLEKHLKPSESTEVLSYISFNDDIENSFPETYQLDIEVNGRALSINKPKLLQLLKQSDYHLKGNTIHTWKISDKTLCPYTQFSRRN